MGPSLIKKCGAYNLYGCSFDSHIKAVLSNEIVYDITNRMTCVPSVNTDQSEHLAF